MSIFVFGSNLAGRHGRGSALHARRHYGAVYGVGIGPTGAAYAIPTKGSSFEVLPLEEIAWHVRTFLAYAAAHPEMKFHVVRIGCGLAGYTDAEMAPLFTGATPNCTFDKAWEPWLKLP